MFGNYGRSIYTMDAMQAALGFLQLQQTIIEPQVYRQVYPDIQYPRLVPVVTLGNEWAKSVTYTSMDSFGKAAWFANQASDVPLVDVERQQFEQGIEMAAVGYRYNLEELGQAMIAGVPLQNDRAQAARRAYEEFVDDVALFGDTMKNWTGLTNNTTVTATTLPADGTGGLTTFASKSADLIIRDFNSVLSGIWNTSLQTEVVDTVLMPITVLTKLSSTFMSVNNNMTILQYLQQYNVFTLQAGRPLNIVGIRRLDTAGAGGLSRMVVYRNDPQVVRMHIPMPQRFLPAYQRAPLVFDVPSIFRLGGVEVRRPGAFRYVDGA